MSRDTSQVAADRRLWLAERCPSCGAAAGARCRERSSARRAPPPRLALHAARGWRQRGCPACKARPGEPCLTPRGRIKPAPHAVRLSAARGELLSLEEVWRALERLGASGARVRFSGGGGRQGTLESLSTDDGGRELARWAGESELAGALAAPDMGPLRQLPHPAADSRGTRLERRRALARARRHARGRALRTDPPSRRRPTPSLRHSSTRRATCRPRRLRAHRRKAHAGRASAAVSRSPRGPLLRQALPTSRLPRQAARAIRPRTPQAARALLLVPRTNAHHGLRPEGPLLQQTLPTSRPPAPGSRSHASQPSLAATCRATRRADNSPRRPSFAAVDSRSIPPVAALQPRACSGPPLGSP